MVWRFLVSSIWDADDRGVGGWGAQGYVRVVTVGCSSVRSVGKKLRLIDWADEKEGNANPQKAGNRNNLRCVV